MVVQIFFKMPKQFAHFYFSVFSLLLLVCAKWVQCLPTYDFIVVGAGAGGGALSRRLAESGKFSVLLIESGGFPREGHDIPGITPEFLDVSDVTFQFESTPQRNAALRTNGRVPITAGRMLGGGTSLNYMWFNRGHPRDWDNWADVTGDGSWSYANMLKYFKTIENYVGDFPSDQHSVGGPITVSRPKYAPGLEYWLAAGKELGYALADSNGPQQRSFAPVEFNKKHGRRVSSWLGYVQPILQTSKLQVLIDTNVTQVIFEGNRAVGVRFVTNNKMLPNDHGSTVFASNEVIISAGTYNSPLILQRSGIGPADVLLSANIPVFKELPTGLNFQDHPAINLNFIINNVSLVVDEQRDLTPANYQYFNAYGDGPYSSVRGATGQALISSSVTAQEANFDWPDLQLCMSHSTTPYVTPDDFLHLSAQKYLKLGEAPMSSSIFLMRPKSRGTIRVDPANVLGAPMLDVAYLTDSRDMQIFLDGIYETLAVFEKTEAYGKLGARFAPVDLPQCQGLPMRSQEYWICYMMQTMQGGTHPAGTCKMGRRDDPTAVVDSELRVIGVEGLRVVDASVMPFVVNANPTAAVYGIAEKAAEMILAQWVRGGGSSLLGHGHSSHHDHEHADVGTFNVNNIFGYLTNDHSSHF